MDIRAHLEKIIGTLIGNAMNVVTVVINKIKDLIENIKNEIRWILTGCPKPVKIPINSKKRDKDDE